MTNKDSFNGGTNIGVGNTAGGDIYVAGRDVHIQKNGEERPVAKYEAKVIWKTPLTKSITSKETRYPLMFNYALSGIGNRLSIEKVEVAACPICNGKMKYYNKPIAWDRIIDSNGNEKRIVTERVPALECKRNSKHWAEVDPAEDKV